MAIGITVAQLAVELRISADPNTDPPEPYRTLLTRQRHVADTIIDEYAPAAPGNIQDEAAVRYIGYVLDRPTSYAGTAYSDVFRHSGAMNVLAPYHDVESIFLDGLGPSTPVASTPDAVIVPSHPVHPGTHNRYIGWSDDIVVTPAELLAGAVFTTDRLTVPERIANGYLWFAVDNAVGYPDSLIRGANPTNQLPFYQRQAGLVLAEGVNYIVGVNANLLNPLNVQDTVVTLGYAV